ncbi:Nitrogen permease regulator 3 [Massospora cicadina]|nr:Nitrogen permease regulator 3 [Massospora cicadina]
MHRGGGFTGSYLTRVTRKDSADQTFGEASGIEKSNSEFSIQNEEDGDGMNLDESHNHLLYDTVLGFDTALIANIFSPKPALSQRNPQAALLASQTFQNAQSPEMYSTNFSDISHSQITMFHVVFVLQPFANGGHEEHDFGDSLFENIVVPYTAALKHEQARCNYIRCNAETIMSLTDLAKESGHSRDTLMRNILQTSTMAQEIAQIFACITADSVAQLCINNYIHLALQIPPRFKNFMRRSDSMYEHSTQDYIRNRIHTANSHLPQGIEAALSQDAGFLHRYVEPAPHYSLRQGTLLPSLRPYHTLLLLDTPEDLLRALPPDASPKLIQLIQILTPTQSLAELQIQLDCSLAYIFRLAAHLVYWQKAQLIDVISVRNVYTLAPQCSLGYDALAEDFGTHFPCLICLRFSRSYPFRGLTLSSFLIRSSAPFTLRVVVPLHTYIYFMIPQYVKRGYNSEDFERWLAQFTPSRSPVVAPGGLDSVALDGIALVSSPAQMMEAEREWIKKVAHSQPKEVADLFQRLVKYFNGQYHVDEIVYYESITRRDLRAILSRFREELITVLHYRGIGESEFLL